MSNQLGLLFRPVFRGEFLRSYDFSYEAAQHFLKSADVERTLHDTFADAKFEFEDLDGHGLSPLKETATTQVEPSDADLKNTPPQAEPDSLEQAFGPEKPFTLTTFFGSGWLDVTPGSPVCFSSGLDQAAGTPRRRKLSRSPRFSGINPTFSGTKVDDPFACIPESFERGKVSDLQEKKKFGISLPRPLSPKSRLRSFTLLELPTGYIDEGYRDAEDHMECDPPEVSIGPPPGLPSPLSIFQPSENVAWLPTPV